MDDFPLNQQQLLETVIETATVTGAILKTFFEEEHTFSMKETTKAAQVDFATEADVRSEEYILEQLQALRPTDVFIAEESDPEALKKDGAELTWFIDPLDGTTNFSRGNTTFAVSIAAKRNDTGETILAVVHAPLLKKTWFTTEELGASFLKSKGELFELPKVKSSRGNILVLGLGHNQPITNKVIAKFNDLSEVFSSLRTTGSVAIELCTLAEGAVDAHFADSAHTWDFTAGAYIAKNAGKITAAIPANGPTQHTIISSAKQETQDFLLSLLSDLL